MIRLIVTYGLISGLIIIGVSIGVIALHGDGNVWLGI
jgi:hypothetical protein